jgi:hypothetical protein
MSDEPEKEFRRRLLDELTRVSAENIVLQSICAMLIGELALLHTSDPWAKRDHFIASAQGIAAGVAVHFHSGDSRPEIATQAMTAVVDRIAEMVEASFPKRRDREPPRR